MPAAGGQCRAHGRPASENLQGRKPRDGGGGRFVTRGIAAIRALISYAVNFLENYCYAGVTMTAETLMSRS
jgi:hypothetical protein